MSKRSTAGQIGASATSRRDVVVGGAALAASAAGLTPSFTVAASDAPDTLAIQPGDRFEIIKGPLKSELVRADMLTAGDKQYECFPVDPATGIARRKNRLNRALVLRVDPAQLTEETRVRSAGEGILVFSAICTHKGCTIKSWMKEELRLRCHCHLTEFSVTDVGRVMGGPAKFPLPMVPLAVDEGGYIVAAAGFTSEPGGKTR